MIDPDTIASITDQLWLKLELRSELSKEFISNALQNVRLFDRKQQDYGPRNISGYGTIGVVVRMNDKFERLKTLLGKKRRKPQNESILDSLRDISNYANIAIMVEEGTWPKD